MIVLNNQGLNNYDNTMLTKVKSWFPNTIYADTAITYNTIFNLMDNADNQFKVPLINVYRPRGVEPVPMQNFAARKQGELFQALNIGARYITVNLMYQFDIYAKTLEEVNIMVETLMKTFNFFPTVTIIHEDTKTGDKFKEEYEITYLSGPTPQNEFDNDDRVYRQYIQYTIQNAKLYDFTDYHSVDETELEIKIEETEIDI